MSPVSSSAASMHRRSITSVVSRTRSFSGTRPTSSVICSTERGSSSVRARLGAEPPADIADREAEAGLVAVGHRRPRIPRSRRGTILAAQGGGEQPYRAVLAQIGDQHVEIDAGPAEPTLQRFAARLLLGRQAGRGRGRRRWRSGSAHPGSVTTKPSGRVLDQSGADVDLARAATHGAWHRPRAGSAGPGTARRSPGGTAKPRPAARVGHPPDARATLSARPVARTPASSARTPGRLSTAKPSGNDRARPAASAARRAAAPAAGLASTTLCVAASTISTASEVTWNSSR